jgi:hypothetical protein
MSERAADDDGEAVEVYDGVPPIGEPLRSVSSSLVRDWVRSALVPAALTRLYEIGMGTTKFDVPTMAGNVVNVEAPAAVQRAALRDVIAIGVPPQVGLTGEGDDTPGVLALGEWELDQARGEVHAGSDKRLSEGDVTSTTPESIGERIEQFAEGIANEIVAKVTGGYTPPEGHTVVEITESATASEDDRAAEPPPPVNPDRNALAKEILARRRAQKQGRVSLNGSHPNLT